MKTAPLHETKDLEDDLPLPATAAGWQARTVEQLTDKVLPLGLLCLLTGMMWAGDRQLFHQLFYLLVALPAFMLALTSSPLRTELVRNPVFIAFLCFAAYVSASIAWSGADDSALSLLKRPLYVVLLFIAMAGVAFHRPDRFTQVLRVSAVIAVAAGGILLVLFHLSDDGGRLTGYGALYNPLLTSHVFGFFLVLWIAYWIQERRLLLPQAMVAVAILGAVLLATGSRTPLLALSGAIFWLGLMSGGRRGAGACGLFTLAIGVIVMLWPESVTQRGLSYRPEIWAEAFRQAREFPLFGHGYDHPLSIHVNGIDFVFLDPHNMTLSVFYQGGLAGLLLWLALYLTALITCWKYRRNPVVLGLSATVVYGFAAAMTEGGSFLSRPKEHWFLIWVPMALVAAATTLRQPKDER
ncbi:MAG: hypothetical protein Q7J47_15275 [Azoarcus sp.]|nr:hypothetical protein [Azoarcus sp.]